MPSDTIRRIVTGHDAEGRSVIVSDGAPPTVYTLPHVNVRFQELWNTGAAPATVGAHVDPTLGPVVLPPPANGTRFRIIDIPPDRDTFRPGDETKMKAVFGDIGDAGASTAGAPKTRHPAMHRTESIDYAFVIDGEITLLLDEGEADLKAGDVVVQRGSNHAWANRSERPCRILFVLVSGRFEPALRQALDAQGGGH